MYRATNRSVSDRWGWHRPRKRRAACLQGTELESKDAFYAPVMQSVFGARDAVTSHAVMYRSRVQANACAQSPDGSRSVHALGDECRARLGVSRVVVRRL